MTPAQRLRSTTLEQMEAAWQRSDQIFGLLAPEALQARPIALRQPFLFYIGHLPAFAWNHLGRRVAGRPPFAEQFDLLFERGIDPPDDGDAPEEEAWPPPEEVLAYRDRVRGLVPELLDEAGSSPVARMVLEHELMHHETLLYMVQQLAPQLKRRSDVPAAPPHAIVAAQTPVSVPAGRVVLGAPRSGGFRWDNEHPEYAVEVAAFRIDALPVTNREFQDFVADGGYEDGRLWSDDAWRWITQRAHRCPGSWVSAGGEVRVRTAVDDRSFDEAAQWPASVMHCEATAFARWRGGRLPTEAEYHRAAFGVSGGERREHPWGDDAPRPEHGNFGFQLWSPAPVGSYPGGASAFGVHELVGNGWEWTSSPFGPFPGFEPLDGYEGYSADFFDDRHFVMLGGSWATDTALLRRSLRNWFQPHYPYAFSKFRVVRDA